MQSQVKTKAKLEIQKGLNFLSNILPSKSELRDSINIQAQDIANQKIQTIHKLILDTQINKPFICTEWNKHKHVPATYRSPYTNNYYPQTQSSEPNLSPILRDLEQKGNILFQEYARLYYEDDGVVSNFYVYETEEGINVIFVLRKEYNQNDMEGIWSSTNYCQIRGDPYKSSTYRLMTQVLYQMKIKMDSSDNFFNISGVLKKNRAESKKPMQEYEIDEFHLMTVGKLVEQCEGLLRQQLESIFVAKSLDIYHKNRFQHSKIQENSRSVQAKKFCTLRGESKKVVQ